MRGGSGPPGIGDREWGRGGRGAGLPGRQRGNTERSRAAAALELYAEDRRGLSARTELCGGALAWQRVCSRCWDGCMQANGQELC